MLKRTIEYVDYNGVERKEDFYFNLTSAEVTEMQMSINGGLTAYVYKLIAAQDAPSIMNVFKDLILKSYGEKSLDGKRFIKNDEIRDAFAQTEAYSQLFMELATNAKAAEEFVNGIIPSELNKQLNETTNSVNKQNHPAVK